MESKEFGNFIVTKCVELPEIHCTLTELEHDPSGAIVMHLANDDPENVFCLSFRTTPETSNGVAHILEHTVLCGSKKFPIKDPFFLMGRRSLNTFMNAFTGADFTSYPAATLVKKDFYNLLDVYLDSVFYPNLYEESFRQEGHRLEFTIPNDPESPLVYKGIVYNEMKGAMASPDSRLVHTMHALLYPNTTYGHNSGGNPHKIPKLTYEEMKEFHRQYYHPSRCLFYFYGNFPLSDHLRFIEKKVLHNVEKVDPLPSIATQPRFSEPKRYKKEYPIREEESIDNKTTVCFGWLTCHIKEQELLLALIVIETAILGNDSSPLKQAFLKTGLCKQISSYIDADCAEPSFLISLRGCREYNADALEETLRNTLNQLAEEGINLTLLENAIHQIEFYRSEITGDYGPYGLTLFMRSGLLKQHGTSPESGLLIHSLFNKLRNNLENNPKYINTIIKKYLLDNPHFVRLTFVPDRELALKEHLLESERIERIKKQLTEEDKKRIIRDTQNLEKFQLQQEEENIEVLPTVTLSDIPKKSRNYPLNQEKIGNLNIYHHETFTNEILYADLVFPLPKLTKEELPLLQLFISMVPQVGCGDRNYLENLEYIQAYTGSVGAASVVNIQAHDQHAYIPYFYLHGKSLYRHSEKMLRLLMDMVTSADFSDINRIKEILFKFHTNMEHSLSQNALRYAVNLSTSALSTPNHLYYHLHGLGYFKAIQDLVTHFDERKETLVDALQKLQEKMTHLSHPDLVLTCCKEKYQTLKESHFFGLEFLKAKPYPEWDYDFSVQPIENQGRVISSPVAFMSRAFSTVPYTHPDAPGLCLIANLMDNLSIHKDVREKGGAYDGGAVSNTMSGNFYFYSYRDPNIFKTMKAFEAAAKKIAEGKFNDTHIEEAIFEMIQGMDSPVSPGSKGHLAYNWLKEGKTLEIRQQFRDRLLSMKKDQLIHIVKTYIIPQLPLSVPVIFASKELLEKENRLFELAGAQPINILTI